MTVMGDAAMDGFSGIDGGESDVLNRPEADRVL